MTKARCFDLIIGGGISMGGFVILSSLGAVCIGALYNIYILSPTAYAFIIIGALSLGLGGLFLIAGIVLIAVGGAVYAKNYKNKSVSLFNEVLDNKCCAGIRIRI